MADFNGEVRVEGVYGGVSTGAGTATATSTPRIATTTISSTSVKAFLFLSNIKYIY